MSAPIFEPNFSGSSYIFICFPERSARLSAERFLYFGVSFIGTIQEVVCCLQDNCNRKSEGRGRKNNDLCKSGNRFGAGRKEGITD